MNPQSTHSKVSVRREPVIIPTYMPASPDKNPMFLEKRVYQGSSGKVYPLPFIDRISEEKEDREWDAVYLENEYLQVMMLPEIGGRIHVGQDKTNGYDFFYRQNVIKPALVGLAGPWISGGVEFNWPQHHRPSTFMPTDVSIEHHDDGSITVWLSEHDPMNRMKGMHGVCLHPGKAYIELKARVCNRTALPQTFLWWANVAVHVNENYQSFFPPDAKVVADHAKRAMSTFPLAQDSYYGVDYAERARVGVPRKEMPTHFRPSGEYPANDLSWYSNIPVPTSYMCLGTQEDFLGGYDHAAQAGLIHIANHHIAPGKKQWTWGNHEFGYAWDRNLTEKDGPYIELMAGVYTDNQPDFSFLAPGETKTWSQFWYPIQKIGPAQKANLDAALSWNVHEGGVRIGVSVSSSFEDALCQMKIGKETVWEWTGDIAPGQSLVHLVCLELGEHQSSLTFRLLSAEGREILSYSPAPGTQGEPTQTDVPPLATEPLSPEEILSADELYLTGLHLDQYRHATRSPQVYWAEALRRDAGDARCNNAMGVWHLRRGEFNSATNYFQQAIKRLTLRNPNPYDGEPLYNLGLALRSLNRVDEAYAAFYKSTWNAAWQAAGYHALAELDCRNGNWDTALEHLGRALRVNMENLRARCLQVLVLRQLERFEEADAELAQIKALDPLDWWARHLSLDPSDVDFVTVDFLNCDTQVRLDLALDYATSGFLKEATEVLLSEDPQRGDFPSEALPNDGTEPLRHYYLAWLFDQMNEEEKVQSHLKAAWQASPDYCFPARTQEIEILSFAIKGNPDDARAPYYLGNLFYDLRRYDEAIESWELAVLKDPSYSVAWRNLGVAYFNVRHDAEKAREAYRKAMEANSGDARLLYENDQLWKRLGCPIRERLEELEKSPQLVSQRDDLSLEYCDLLNQSGRHADALNILDSRHFQPWEGGEGLALGQHVRTHLAIGRACLAAGNPSRAMQHFVTALQAPTHLGEAKHLLANQSDVHFWLGESYQALGFAERARKQWRAAASFRGDFVGMNVQSFSDMTYFSALSLRRLGEVEKAHRLLFDLAAHAKNLRSTPAKIDYFATSLPTMLLFEDDLQKRSEVNGLFMMGQAKLGLGEVEAGVELLKEVLRLEPSHALAQDLLKEAQSSQ